MKLGMVIYSGDSETVWNAFRLGVFALKQGDEVTVFLLAKGVEYENLNTEKFGVTGVMDDLVAAGGKVLACGTCLKLRNADSTGICAISTMHDLHQLVHDSDKLLTF